MSFSLTLPATTTLDWKPVSLVFTYKNIFRTSPAEALAKAGPAIAEAGALLAVFAGIFSLWLGLSVI